MGSVPSRGLGKDATDLADLSVKPYARSVLRAAVLLPDPDLMTTATLAAYLLTAMISWMPTKVHHREGEAVALARYESIATDIAKVALDENEIPLFAGEDGRTQTALLVASIASYESHFRADVDEGRARGDKGISWCIMQIQVHGKTLEGWSGKDLIDDRAKCLAAGLHLVRESFTMCKSMALRHKLSGYTSGRCSDDPASEARIGRAVKWMKEHPTPIPDKAERVKT